MKEILAKFQYLKDQRHPITGKPLSKQQRMDALFKIVSNQVYGKTYTKEERELASILITQIINE